jgi:hypothetical protein
MVDLSLSRFQQTATSAADSAKLRLDSTGEMTTAKRSWVGRLVRFIGGPTKQDKAANKQMMSGLLNALKTRYGDEIGVKAFLAARPGAQQSDSGSVRANVAKPLTSRQVQDAISYAQSKTAKHAHHDLTQRADRFAPGTDRFDRLLAQKGLRPTDIGDEQGRYFMSRLRDDVAARAIRDGGPPDSGTVKKLAGKLLDHVVALGEDGAGVANRGYKTADRLVGDMAMALAGPGIERPGRLPSPSGSDAPGPGTLLNHLLRAGDDLVSDLMRGGLGVPGGDDMQRPVPEAAQRTFAKLSRSEARQLLDRALAPDGPARKLAFALELATEQRSVKEDPYKMAAVANLARANVMVLAALAERAGRSDIVDKLDQQVGEGVAKLNIGRGDVADVTLTSDALRTAGLEDASGMPEMLRDVMIAIDLRAQAIHDAQAQQERELDEQMRS